jgi:tetratricopeptide (TPR) repeat protein
MSDHAPTPSHDAPAARSFWQRLKGAPSELRQFPGWVRQNPLRASLLAVGLATLTTLLAVSAWFLVPQAAVVKPSIELAYSALESGDLAKARHIALQVKDDPQITYRELAGPLYVLGMAIAHEAAEHDDDVEQRMLYLVAANYLQEAYERGFPRDKEETALLELGRAWHAAGEHERSIKPLRLCVAQGGNQRRKARSLLAEAYARATPPKTREALRENHALLDDMSLDPTERAATLQRECRLQLARGDAQAAQAAIDQLVTLQGQTPGVVRLQVECLIRQADAINSGETITEAARSLLERARQLLMAAPEATLNDSPPLIYLLGQCQQRLGEWDEAHETFSQLYQPASERPEKFAAGLQLLRQAIAKGDFERATELAERFVALPADALRSNPWVSENDVRTTIGELRQLLLDEHKYDDLLALTESPAGIISKTQWLTWRAEAHEAKAASQEQSIDKASAAERSALAAAARSDHRLAAEARAQLAEALQLEREYADQLWLSADQYWLGRDYRQAARMLQRYLEVEPKKRRPEALVQLGECWLAAGKPALAVDPLMQCAEEFRRHPAAYRARIIAAQAQVELNALSTAEQLLRDNVESDELSPDAAPWRDSLWELSKLMHRQGCEAEAKSREQGIDSGIPERFKAAFPELERAHGFFTQAINGLSEFVERYPDDARNSEARYLLAESYRQAAKLPRKQAPTVAIAAAQAAIKKQTEELLTSAVEEYDRLIARLADSLDAHEQSPLEKRLLRNSYFSKADALFDLGRYDDAVRAYSAATSRYQREPESLLAYVQIAACYRLLNKPQEARGTLHQAQAVLARMKPDLPFTQVTPYSRERWQQLLSWLATL